MNKCRGRNHRDSHGPLVHSSLSPSFFSSLSLSLFNLSVSLSSESRLVYSPVCLSLVSTFTLPLFLSLHSDRLSLSFPVYIYSIYTLLYFIIFFWLTALEVSLIRWLNSSSNRYSDVLGSESCDVSTTMKVHCYSVVAALNDNEHHLDSVEEAVRAA